ncbi:MAG: type 3 dihydrofolate reductase [Gammaproteobacteria bacterium]|nr:type 3 dihydrofolate reductase [Gammaproteobacteria bacterium]
MIVSLIWAMAKNRVIGSENRLPWKLPADMQWFRRHTLGKPVIMGRKTFESFGGKILPDRQNIIITRDKNYHPANAAVAHSINGALDLCDDAEEVMIIGGMSLYEQTLPIADRLYMTVVDAAPAGDARFPDFDPNQWREIEKHIHEADDKNAYRCEFSILTRAIE